MHYDVNIVCQLRSVALTVVVTSSRLLVIYCHICSRLVHIKLIEATVHTVLIISL
jgi:hypothetical protein